MSPNSLQRRIVTSSVQEPTMPLTPMDARVQLITENLDLPVVPTAPASAPPAWNLFEHAAYAQQTANQSETTEGKSVWQD